MGGQNVQNYYISVCVTCVWFYKMCITKVVCLYVCVLFDIIHCIFNQYNNPKTNNKKHLLFGLEVIFYYIFYNLLYPITLTHTKSKTRKHIWLYRFFSNHLQCRYKHIHSWILWVVHIHQTHAHNFLYCRKRSKWPYIHNNSFSSLYPSGVIHL